MGCVENQLLCPEQLCGLRISLLEPILPTPPGHPSPGAFQPQSCVCTDRLGFVTLDVPLLHLLTPLRSLQAFPSLSLSSCGCSLCSCSPAELSVLPALSKAPARACGRNNLWNHSRQEPVSRGKPILPGRSHRTSVPHQEQEALLAPLPPSSACFSVTRDKWGQLGQGGSVLGAGTGTGSLAPGQHPLLSIRTLPTRLISGIPEAPVLRFPSHLSTDVTHPCHPRTGLLHGGGLFVVRALCSPSERNGREQNPREPQEEAGRGWPVAHGGCSAAPGGLCDTGRVCVMKAEHPRSKLSSAAHPKPARALL